VLRPLDDAATCCLQVDDEVKVGHHTAKHILPFCARPFVSGKTYPALLCPGWQLLAS
jgi:hypothetical protein